MANNHRAIWDTYTSAWKEATSASKRAALQASTVRGCVYRDPLAHTEGHDALVEYMLDFHKQVPGAYFETIYFLSHHNRSIARWNMLSGVAEKIGVGISYGEYDEQGKLIAMTGFFEPAAQ